MSRMLAALVPGRVATSAARVVAATRADLLAALRRELDELVPGHFGRVLAALSPDCPRAPLKVEGPESASGAELAALADRTGPDGVWLGSARFAGIERRVLAVAVPTDDDERRLSSAFGIEVRDDDLPDEVIDVVRGLCAVVAAAYASRTTDATPAGMVENLVAAQERSRTIAELGDAHETVLTAILACLRSPALDDASARQSATTAAVEALLGLRATADLDRALTEIPADAAFSRLAAELVALARHAGVVVDLAPTEDRRLLPAGLTHGARAITRDVLLAVVDQIGVQRIRIGWTVSPGALTILVRDDGPGELASAAAVTDRTTERISALGGEARVDAAPGWGTTITVELPLAPLRATADPGPTALLNPREREVLTYVAAGRRNREIATRLSISDHTVKFHVANILRKLDVGTRGEAAALVHGRG